MPHMRPSRVLAKLRAGEVATSFKLNFADARAAERRLELITSGGRTERRRPAAAAATPLRDLRA